MHVVQLFIEEKLYQLVGQFNERKINHCLIVYAHFKIETEELVRYCLLVGFYSSNSTIKLD